MGDLGGDRPFGFMQRATWNECLTLAKGVAVFFLTIAMAAVGLGTNFSQLKDLGWNPLCLGLTAELLVGCVSATLIWLLKVLL